MRSIKLLACSAVLLGLSSSINAQEAGKFRVGVGVGMNVNSISNAKDAFDAEDGTDISSKIGFNAGLKADYFFTNNVYLGTGLMFNQKGIKGDYSDPDDPEYKYSEKVTLNYLEIPLHIGYRHPVSNNVAIFGEVGPYFAYAVSGKVKYDPSDPDDETNLFKIKDDAGDKIYKRFDAGIGIHAGVEFNKFQIKVGYDFGLTNLNKTYSFEDYDEDGDTYTYKTKGGKNGTFTVGVAYYF